MSENNHDVALNIEQPGPKISGFRAGSKVQAIIPTTLGELAMVAAAVINGGMAPESYTVPDEQATKSRIMLGIMKGAEVGLPPITALSTIAIINNRPCIWGDGAQALILRSGVMSDYEETWEGGQEKVGAGEEMHEPISADFPDTLTCVVRMWRSGIETAFEGRFSVRDAKRAHLWANTRKQPWLHFPRRMLKVRARAFAQRDGFADVLAGLSIREEIEDLPAPPPEKTDISGLEGLGEQRAIAAPAATEQDPGASRIVPETKNPHSPVESQEQPPSSVGESPARPAAAVDQTPAASSPSPSDIDDSEWWATALSDGVYAVSVPARGRATTGRDLMLDLIKAAPSKDALTNFAAANERAILSIDLASKTAAAAIRSAIAAKLTELSEEELP
jgi:hypothetical protein